MSPVLLAVSWMGAPDGVEPEGGASSSGGWAEEGRLRIARTAITAAARMTSRVRALKGQKRLRRGRRRCGRA